MNSSRLDENFGYYWGAALPLPGGAPPPGVQPLELPPLALPLPRAAREKNKC